MATTARLAPLRLLLGDFQGVIDEAADGGLRGEHHLALCALTKRMHEALGQVDLPVNVNDLQLAQQQAIADAERTHYDEHIQWLETTNDNLRTQNATYFHRYSFLHTQKFLFKKLLSHAKCKEVADEARATCKANDLYFSNWQRDANTQRLERNRLRALENALALAAIRERFA